MDGVLFSLCLYFVVLADPFSQICAALVLAAYVPEYLAVARLEVH
jgi:hypothetical protein